MNNLEYFKYSLDNRDSVENFVKPEGVKVINESADDDPSILMDVVNKLNGLITTYSTLKSMGKSSTEKVVIEVVDKICKILEKRDLNVNYAPFCVYFQVMRYSYASYKENYLSMDCQEKRDLIIYLLDAYLDNRYEMYEYHGYSHMVLQVMSDASSSRRNGTIGIQMLQAILNPLGFKYVHNYEDLISEKFCYIDSDKKGKKTFKDFIKNKNIAFEFQNSRENKYPDMLIKINNDYFILEHKLTNGGGGSQNAEINEIIDFTRYDENDKNIHFISCLQGDFLQYLTEHSTQPKNIIQRENIIEALTDHPNNYFVNGKALEKLVKDYMKNDN